MHTQIMTTTTLLHPAEAQLRDAQTALDWALRHGNPGDISRAKRFMAEAQFDARKAGIR